MEVCHQAAELCPPQQPAAKKQREQQPQQAAQNRSAYLTLLLLSEEQRLEERNTDRREPGCLAPSLLVSWPPVAPVSEQLREASSHSCWRPGRGRVAPPLYSLATRPRSLSTVAELVGQGSLHPGRTVDRDRPVVWPGAGRVPGLVDRCSRRALPSGLGLGHPAPGHTALVQPHFLFWTVPSGSLPSPLSP